MDSLGHRGYYSRGYLPHCDYPGLLQAITYRLSDSLPQSVLRTMKLELEKLPSSVTGSEERKRIEKWLDGGHGSCLLKDPINASLIIENWLHFARKRYDLIAWVVMPNHVHVLIRVYEGSNLATIVQSWKSYTGKRLRRVEEGSRAGARRSQGGLALPEPRHYELTDEEGSRAGARRSQGGFALPEPRHYELIDEEGSRAGARRSQGSFALPEPRHYELTDEEGSRAGARRSQGLEPHGPVWMRDYWDRFIRNEEHYYNAINYIHCNPVKAHLVRKPEDWPWSSAREWNSRNDHRPEDSS